MSSARIVPTAEAAQPLRSGTLSAGRYRTTVFEPTLEFDLADGWHQYFPDDSDEIALGGPGGDLNITRPTEVVNPNSGPALDAPESMIDWLTSHAKLQASEPKDIEIAGIAAAFADVEPPTSDVGLFHYSGGDMHLPPGVPARFYIVPMDGADLVMVVLPPEGSTDLDATVDAVEPIVESLAIAP